MKKSTITLFIFSLLSTFNLKAQIEKYKLSDYKMPDIKFHLLDVELSFAQNNSFDKPIGGGRNDKFKNSSTFLNLGTNYQGFRNSLKWQKELSNSSILFYDRTKEVRPRGFGTRTEKNKDFLFTNNFQATNRRYYDNNYFFELNQNINIEYKKDKFDRRDSQSGSTSDRTDVTKSLTAFLPIKFGKGRIENVGDAQHALFILNGLKKKNVLNRNLSSEEITDLASLISELKNKRFFDFRLRRIAELKMLDTFLNAKNDLLIPNIQYYTTLNDLWNFGGDRTRKSGNRLSFAIYPGVSYNNKKRDITNEPIEFAELYNLNGGLEYINEKPINQIWQNTFSAYLYLGVVGGKYDQNFSTRNKVDIPKFNIGIENTFGFYPNTRTSVEYSLIANYDSFLNRFDRSNDVFGIDGQRSFVSSRLDIVYFISPRFSITIAASSDFHNLYSEEAIFIPLNILYSLSNYPYCNDFNCYEYQSEKNYARFNFGIAMEYNLF